MVGATGFEPATPCSQSRCATKLRYAPTEKEILQEEGSVFSGKADGPIEVKNSITVRLGN